MTLVDVDSERPAEAAPEPARPRPITMRPTVISSIVVLALCGLVLGVGPMIWRSPGVRIPAGATRVNVSLFEFGIRIDASTPVKPGKDAFVITNTGTIPHELVGFATAAGATALPLRADGDVNEESSTLRSVLDTGDSLAPGATKVIAVTLVSGTHYVFVCNLPGHWHLGMRVDVTPQ
jgi:hypothetical protein